MLITVLCRFSLFLVKYFSKIDQRHSPDLDRAWLPAPDEGAAAMSESEWRCCLDIAKPNRKRQGFTAVPKIFVRLIKQL